MTEFKNSAACDPDENAYGGSNDNDICHYNGKTILMNDLKGIHKINNGENAQNVLAQGPQMVELENCN